MENHFIKISGPDAETAIERGLARLGLARDQTEIEILEQGSRGILGIGARDAVVRLTRIEAPLAAVTPGHEEAPGSSTEAEQDAGQAYTISEDEVAETSRQTVAELLDQMGIDCQVVIRTEEAADDEPAPITVDVVGENLDVLIGRHGEVLNALQYISRLIVSREVEHWVNMVVDVDNYKQRRAKSLKQLAKRIAERVARTQQPVALEPMPPNERRVIHIELHDHPTVTTQSVGRGDSRKVTIIPRR